MSKLQILFCAWIISFVVLSLPIFLFRYVYFKELNRKKRSTASIKGSVVGYIHQFVNTLYRQRFLSIGINSDSLVQSR